jgi:hypothetical protein
VRDWPSQLEDVAPGDDPAVVAAPAPGPEAEPTTHEQEVRR